jgi:hypothetical protein
MMYIQDSICCFGLLGIIKRSKRIASQKTVITSGLVLIASLALFLGTMAMTGAFGAQSNQESSSFVDTRSAENPAIWNQAPYPGYEYFVQYNTTTGNINAVMAVPSQTVIQELIGKCASNQSNSMTCINDGLPTGVADLNLTSYTNITAIEKHMDAFYVNLNAQDVELRSGWKNCSNPNYGNGTNPCN